MATTGTNMVLQAISDSKSYVFPVHRSEGSEDKPKGSISILFIN